MGYGCTVVFSAPGGAGSDYLRVALSWLGEPVVKQKKHNNTLVFRVHPTDVGAGEIHLKVEINFQEEIVSFVENYSLFVGINVYLPRIIVRIFVDFD